MPLWPELSRSRPTDLESEKEKGPKQTQCFRLSRPSTNTARAGKTSSAGRMHWTPTKSKNNWLWLCLSSRLHSQEEADRQATQRTREGQNPAEAKSEQSEWRQGSLLCWQGWHGTRSQRILDSTWRPEMRGAKILEWGGPLSEKYR